MRKSKKDIEYFENVRIFSKQLKRKQIKFTTTITYLYVLEM